MKIVLLINYISPYRIPLFELLSSQLQNLTIFTSVDMGADRNWNKSHGNFNEFRQKSLTLKQTWRHPEGFSDQIYIYIPLDTLQELKKRQPEIIISHEFGVRSLQCLLYKLLHPTTKFVIWANISDHTEKNRGALRLLLRYILIRSADQIWVNGKAGERYIRQIYRNVKAVRFFPYPTDEKFITPLEPKICEPFCKKLLTVGNLIERKGILQLLNSLSGYLEQHPEQFINYRIIGDGPLKDAITNYPVSKNLQIDLSGFLPYDQLPREYTKADLLVFPTLADEWGVVVNEAMATGLPVLGSCYSQAVEEMVMENETGWIFIPDDINNSLFAIQNALSVNTEKYEAMRKACQLKANGISMKNIADRIVEEINHLKD